MTLAGREDYMGGEQTCQAEIMLAVTPDQLVPSNHPLSKIKPIVGGRPPFRRCVSSPTDRNPEATLPRSKRNPWRGSASTAERRNESAGAEASATKRPALPPQTRFAVSPRLRGHHPT
jgi:hypothetical protein